MTEQNPHAKTWEETVEPEQARRKNWAGFVENEAVTFFEKFDPKSSLSRTAATRPNCSAPKTTAIKIEYTSWSL